MGEDCFQVFLCVLQQSACVRGYAHVCHRSRVSDNKSCLQQNRWESSLGPPSTWVPLTPDVCGTSMCTWRETVCRRHALHKNDPAGNWDWDSLFCKAGFQGLHWRQTRPNWAPFVLVFDLVQSVTTKLESCKTSDLLKIICGEAICKGFQVAEYFSFTYYSVIGGLKQQQQ